MSEKTVVCGQCGFKATFASESTADIYGEGYSTVGSPATQLLGVSPPAACPICHANTWRLPLPETLPPA